MIRTISYTLNLSSAGRSMKRKGCLGVGELALDGKRDDTVDDTTLVAVDSALLAVLPAGLRCFAIAAYASRRLQD